MMTSPYLNYVATFAAVLSTVYWFYRKWNVSSSARHAGCKLPPGSMGLPFIGETLQFFAPSTTCDFSPFVKDRVEKYGPIFKTKFVLQPMVVSTDPEANQFVFQQEGKLFESWFPSSFWKVFQLSADDLHGPLFKYLKNVTLRLYGRDNLRQVFLEEMVTACVQSLKSWSRRPSFDLKDALANMLFDLSAKKLISYQGSDNMGVHLRKNFDAFIQVLISPLPFNIPGTRYRKCIQGRNAAMEFLKGTLRDRLNEPEKRHDDFLDHLIDELKKENTLMTEHALLELLFGLLFASYETTTLVLTLGVKLLIQHPQVLRHLTDENDAIIRKRDRDADSGLTWTEYKSMEFTPQVVNEMLRVANIVPALFRKVLQDTEINGYIIPAGWVVMVVLPAAHLKPEIHEDPLSFNPWRWKDVPEMHGATKQFMPFGGGIRYCLGADFSKLAMATFLHYLVTGYRVEAVKGGNIVRSPVLQFPQGFHVKLLPRS